MKREVKGLMAGLMAGMAAVGLAFGTAAVVRRETSPRHVARPTAPRDPVIGARLEAGRRLFSANCAPCHGDQAQGAVGPRLRGRRLPEQQVLRTVQTGVPGKMPSFMGRISEGDMADLAAYVHSLP